jgi:hypothetical protein
MAGSESLLAIADHFGKKRLRFLPGARFSMQDFQAALTDCFVQRSRDYYSSESRRAVKAVREYLGRTEQRIGNFAARRDALRQSFDEEATALLRRIAREESRAVLAAPGDAEPANYKAERLGLLNRCRGEQQLGAALLGGLAEGEEPEPQMKLFAQELFAVVRSYVRDREEAASSAPPSGFEGAIERASINLKLRDSPDLTDSMSLICAGGSQKFRDALCQKVRDLDPTASVEVAESLDGGSITYVRLISGFDLKRLADIEFAADCYQAAMQDPSSAATLDLRTHQRADILPLGGEDEGPRLFALSQLLDLTRAFGQGFLFASSRLLPSDVPDLVERQRRAHVAVLDPARKQRIAEERDRLIEACSGNQGFVAEVRRRMGPIYGGVQDLPASPWRELLEAEQNAVEAYLATLGVSAAVGSGGE